MVFRSSVLVLCLLFSTPVFCTDGSGYMILAEMKALVAAASKKLATAVKSYQLYLDVKAMKEDKEKSWDVFNNPLFQEYIGDVSGLQGFEDTYSIVSDLNEIDAMIDQMDDKQNKARGKEKKYWERKRDLMKTYRNLRKLKKANRRSFKNSGRNNSERRSNNITANAASGMFELALNEEARQNKEAQAKQDALIMKHTLDGQMGEAFKELSNPSKAQKIKQGSRYGG